MSENKTKVLEILGNEENISSIKEIKSIEDMKTFLSSKGAEISDDEISEIVSDLFDANDEEISEEDLESVAGGNAAAVLKGMWDAACLVWKKAGQLGEKYYEWEANGFKSKKKKKKK